MRIQLSKSELGRGLEIGVDGFEDNPANASEYPSQVYIEIHNGKLHVYVWNGASEDPVAHVELDPLRESVVR